jgi:hypothetical protein
MKVARPVRFTYPIEEAEMLNISPKKNHHQRLQLQRQRHLKKHNHHHKLPL